MEDHLILFTRYPEPGRAKTRLIPAVGAEGAAALQREMTRRTLAWATPLGRAGAVSLEVRFEGGDADRMAACFGAELTYRPQGAGDLGRRMSRAVQEAFRRGARRVVVVGSDCPDLDGVAVIEAFRRLAQGDLVLGPATDGGYYLIGLRRPASALWAGIPWGSDQVLNKTLRAAEAAGLRTSLLEPLPDVDRPEDLATSGRSGGKGSRVSVVVAVLNEAAALQGLLPRLRAARNVETIVVDGGSGDDSPRIARSWGSRVLAPIPLRGRQWNAGAEAATGELLLFLHVDTEPPCGFEERVRQTLAEPGVVAGAFQLAIAGARGSLALIQRVANLRARYLQMPYGDQAPFLSRRVFQQVGGFPELPILEDYALMRRLRRKGRIRIVADPVITSARRWETLGPWRATLVNQAIIVAYHLGVSPARLACWYRRGRRAAGSAS